MVTRWRSRVALVGILFLTFGIISTFIVLTFGSTYLKNDFFDDQNFESLKNEFIYYVNQYEIYDSTIEEVKSQISITDNEISVYRSRYADLQTELENINEMYKYKIDDAKGANNTKLVESLTTERDQKAATMTKIFEDDEYVRAKLKKSREKEIDDYFKAVEQGERYFIEQKNVFAYYVEDADTGRIYTNLSDTGKEYFNEKNMLHVEKWNYNLAAPSPPGMEVPARTLTGLIGVKKDAPPDSNLMYNYHQFLKQQKVFYFYTISGGIVLILGLIILLKASLRNSRWYGRLKWIPMDVNIVLTGAIGFFTLVLLWDSPSLFFLLEDKSNIAYNFAVTSTLVGITVILLKLIASRMKDEENRIADWKNSLLYKGYDSLRMAFLNRRIGTQTILLLGVIVAFIPGGIILGGKWYPYVFPVLFVYLLLFAVIAIPAMYTIIKRAGYFNEILAHTTELANGKNTKELLVSGKSPLASLAATINTLKAGVEFSQREQMKSERLKSELITNVSHDLRTPLTSIITYSELLKTPNLEEQVRNSYIEIIDKKSKRLKVLIDDLFEASKMASGNIELTKTKVDITQLLEQALAEYEEKMNESTLHFRITSPEEPIFANVDGQKIWRVFDNLIGNILKYSLENTRVYIQVKQNAGRAIISFKNVTKYELSENVDELFERFKRGDESRHTEGSGLGLAIAKSIIDLHEGKMNIEVDGDLFKVTIILDSNI